MQNGQVSCSLMVIYNFDPDLREILRSIMENSLDYAIFIDNSTLSPSCEQNLVGAINAFPGKIIYKKNNGNIGLSKALNDGVSIAKERGCSLIYVLDQDSNLTKDYFRKMYRYYMNSSESDCDFGILGPIVSNYGGDIEMSLFKSKISRAYNLINSGMVVPMRTFDKVGLYDENLFLGSIDTEFVERTMRKNLNVYRVNEVMIIQNFGMTIKPYNMLLKIINCFTKYYSIVLISLGKTNEYRHLLVDYSDLQSQLNYSDKVIYGKKSGIFNILDKIESLIEKALHEIIRGKGRNILRKAQ